MADAKPPVQPVVRTIEAAVLFTTYTDPSGWENGVRRNVEHYAAVASVEGAERLADILNLCQALIEDYQLVASDEMYVRGLICGVVTRALDPSNSDGGRPL